MAKQPLLANLPSRGAIFLGEGGKESEANPEASPSGAGAFVVGRFRRPYVCDHPTAPPRDQTIGTDPQNILIRSLLLKKKRKKRARAASPLGAKGGGTGPSTPARAAKRKPKS